MITIMPWDYCVIWTLGDDPSRFIQWGACCCSGGNEVGKHILRIKTENSHLCVVDECKDQLIKNPVRTHACKSLAKLPDAIPLYSGIHGDVLMSKKPSWLNSDDEPNGTHVLIPTAVGLIELFSSKQLPEDQKLMDFISFQFKVPYTQDCRKGTFQIEESSDRETEEKIKTWMYTLGSLVPNISKMDRMATVGDAANHVKELRKTIENYCDEHGLFE